MLRLAYALFALSATVGIAGAAHASDCVGCDRWRQLKIDLCQELPTLEESLGIYANGGEIPTGTYTFTIGDEADCSGSENLIADVSEFPDTANCTTESIDYQARIAACVRGDAFADLMALWIHDFTLTYDNPGLGQKHWLYQRSAQYSGGTIYYWDFTYTALESGSRLGCLRGVTTSAMSLATLEANYLDRIYDPYWTLASDSGTHPTTYTDSGDTFVYACRRTGVTEEVYALEDSESSRSCTSVLGALSAADLSARRVSVPSIADDSRYLCTRENSADTTWTRYDCDAESAAYSNFYYQQHPCGCGENARWCIPGSLTDSRGINQTDVYLAISEDVMRQPQELVGHIVRQMNSGVVGYSFLDIFDSDFVYVTPRLQLWYDILQREYLTDYRTYNLTTATGTETESDCARVVNVGQVDECCGSDTACAAQYVTYSDGDYDNDGELNVPTLDPSGTYSHSQPEYLREESGRNGGWTEVSTVADRDANGQADLAFLSGILTTTGFLQRQPTETNVAGQVHRFFFCEDPGWKSIDTTSASTSGWQTELWGSALSYSTLYRTTAALEPFTDPSLEGSCKGCHVVVNPLATFRNRWNVYGYYQPYEQASVYTYSTYGHAIPADGIALGVTGSDLTGLGAILRASGQVQRCIINRHVELLTGDRLDVDDPVLDQLHVAFQESNFDIADLYLEMVDLLGERRSR